MQLLPVSERKQKNKTNDATGSTAQISQHHVFFINLVHGSVSEIFIYNVIYAQR